MADPFHPVAKSLEPRGIDNSRPSLEAGLYVVATPIGNLRDITLRALDVLQGADLVLAEDTRVTGKLLAAYGITAAKLQPYHEHNAEAARPGILAALGAGKAVALVSDAGTPLVSDPGFKLVRAAIEAGARILPLPGASALLAGLVMAGLPTDRFLFAGFPPSKAGARRAFLAELAEAPASLVFYESGPRLGESLTDMAAMLGDRPAAVAREITKLFEECVRGSLGELAARYQNPPKGEIVVLVGPPAAPALDESALDDRLRALLDGHSVKEAAVIAAAELGVPKRAAYARALALKPSAPP